MFRAAAGALRSGLEAGAAAARGAAQAQQRRGAHELHAHTNKHVEKWLSRREDIENEFVWDSRNLRGVLIGAFLLPIATYNILVYMNHQVGSAARAPHAQFASPPALSVASLRGITCSHRFESMHQAVGVARAANAPEPGSGALAAAAVAAAGPRPAQAAALRPSAGPVTRPSRLLPHAHRPAGR